MAMFPLDTRSNKLSSGCSQYEVFIAGRKAMYFGRDGEFYTEPFPAKK